jgi:hypothetical protein
MSYLHQGCTIFVQISCNYKILGAMNSTEGSTNIKRCRSQFSHPGYLEPEVFAHLSYMLWSTAVCHIIYVPWLWRSGPGSVPRWYVVLVVKKIEVGHNLLRALWGFLVRKHSSSGSALIQPSVTRYIIPITEGLVKNRTSERHTQAIWHSWTTTFVLQLHRAEVPVLETGSCTSETIKWNNCQFMKQNVFFP